MKKTKVVQKNQIQNFIKTNKPKKDSLKKDNHKSSPIIGVVGLGIMGGLMAETLIQQGHRVMGFDIDAKAMTRFKEAGGDAADSIHSICQTCPIVILSLATSQALASVVDELSISLLSSRKSILVLETSTLPLEDKNKANEVLSQVGAAVMDCPISGTATNMKDRDWTIYISGPKNSLLKAEPIFKAFTDNVPYVGEYGSGTKMKYAANHLVAIYNVAYAEVVTFARKMDLDPAEMLKLFGNSPFLGTGVMRLRMPFMIDRKYTPPTMKVQVWQKDMQVIGDMAKSINCPLPLFTACAPIYTSAMSHGLALQDTASTAEVIGSMAGIKQKKENRKKN